MRRTLDFLYDASAWLAAVFMILVLAMVLASVLGRLLHFNLTGSDAYAGYAMAGAGFLALAHTLKRGEHIRVTLLLSKLQGRYKRAMELWAVTAAVALSGLFAFFSARLAWQSHLFNDISTGNDATPLWIPQLLMAFGTLVLFIAFLDEWWLEVTGQQVAHVSQETHHE